LKVIETEYVDETVMLYETEYVPSLLSVTLPVQPNSKSKKNTHGSKASQRQEVHKKNLKLPHPLNRAQYMMHPVPIATLNEGPCAVQIVTTCLACAGQI
jgi:hypothetical protein